MVNVREFLGRLSSVKESSSGWSACCPAHEDRSPSLSVSEGTDGRILVKCHRGCSVDTICESLGLQLSDLMPDKPNEKETRRHNAPHMYETPEAAIRALTKDGWEFNAKWPYIDAEGTPVGMVLRWDTPTGKEIRPLCRVDGGWKVTGMKSPRVLFDLPRVASSQQIYVVEGEKCCTKLRDIGLVATTSTNGSNAADKTDWSPLAGKDVVIVPDFDEAGETYANEVVSILANLVPPPRVRRMLMSELPSGAPMPSKGDVADWIAGHEDAPSPEVLCEQFQQLVQERAESVDLPEPERLCFRPFPVHALPDPIRRYVLEAHRAIQCDPSFIALPLLTALASVIGLSRCLNLKNGWSVPSIVWGAIIGDSGTSKSPALYAAMDGIALLQRNAQIRYEQEMVDYEAELKRYNAAKNATDQCDLEKPVEPIADRLTVDDTTIEALATILVENPRGLLLSNDELASWVGSFDRYSSGSGADAAKYLSMFNGRSLTVDRKTGKPKTLHIPSAALSVAGGIQPRILRRAMTDVHRASGLMARFLLVWPPRVVKQWAEDEISDESKREIHDIFERLYELHPKENEAGIPEPQTLRLSPAAKALWIDYFNRHSQQQADLEGDLSAAWSKLEEYAARLALIFQLVRDTHNSDLENEKVDESSMRSAIELTEWFKYEAKRVYHMLCEDEKEAEQRKLIDWIRLRGPVTVPEVQRGHRRLKTAQETQEALEELVKRGLGRFTTMPIGKKGGRPSRVFELVA